MLIERLGEKCGIFGVYSPGYEAARLTHSGIFTLQHRGQESAGIVTSDESRLYLHKGMGLVTHVFDENTITTLLGFTGIGHTRYSTSKGSNLKHAQPVMREDGILALAHNGNLPSTIVLETYLRENGLQLNFSNDSEMMADVLGYFLRKGASLEEAIKEAYPLFTGAFCLAILTHDKLAVVRDEKGIRPLSYGKLNGGYVFASETCALDVVQAEYIGDVKPGEMIVVDEYGIHNYQLKSGEQKLDIFEFVYFARPDSIILGKSVDVVRQNLGKELAKENQIKADVVIPIPDSAIPAAIGFSRQSGIPFEMGLIKNRYIHRTFISPEQHTRHRIVQLKLNPMKHVISGKRVIVIDDSIVRGTTSKQIMRMIKDAGAKEIHLLVSSPPVKFPDFYGIDTPNQKELIAAVKNIKEIAKELGVDSLHYLSYGGLIKAIGLSEDLLCTALFNGNYPVDIGERRKEITYEKNSRFNI